MLHILLLILKIIGIIFLSILGIILLIILLVCLTPLKYEIYGQVNNSKESIAGRIKFGYFFNILNGQCVYKDGRPRYYVALFKKKLICSKKPKEDTFKAEENKKESYSKGEPSSEQEMKVPNEEEITEDDFKYINNRSEESWDVIEDKDLLLNKDENKEEHVSDRKQEQKKEKKTINSKPNKKNRYFSAKEKIKNMYNTICDKIKMLKEKKEIIDTFFNDKIHRKAILKVFKEIKCLFKKLKPYNLKGKIHYGFEEPDLTGKVLAVTSMVLPFIGGDLIIEPDFNNELVYSGNISFKGKIKISYFLSLCIKLAVRKSVWTTFFDAKHTLKDMK